MNLGWSNLLFALNYVDNLTADQVRQLAKRAADMLRVVDLGPTAIVTTNDASRYRATAASPNVSDCTR